MGLSQHEQRAFERLVSDLRIDDPKFLTRMDDRSHGRWRRIRTVRAGGALCCFAALLALTLVGPTGVGAALTASGLALTGVLLCIGAAVPAPLPTRVRAFRIWIRIHR